MFFSWGLGIGIVKKSVIKSLDFYDSQYFELSAEYKILNRLKKINIFTTKRNHIHYIFAIEKGR